MTDCQHGGELVAHIELHKIRGAWCALAFLPGRDCVPEAVVQVDDPGTALSEVAWLLANEVVKETG